MKVLLSLGLLVSSWRIVAGSEHAQATRSSDITQTAEGTYDAVHATPDPLQMGAMPASGVEDYPRHRQEMAHLTKRMDRKQGNWGTSHPRSRILEALFGFSKYRERSMVELDRWRGLYRNVGRK